MNSVPEKNNAPPKSGKMGFFLRPAQTLDKGMMYVERTICVGGTIVMVVSILLDIFARNVLNSSIFWAQELARYMMILAIFFGCSVCVREKAHLGIDMLVNALPQKLRKIVDLSAYLFAFFAFAILAYLQFSFAARNLRFSQTTPTLNIQFGHLYAAIGIAMIFSAVRSLLMLLDNYVFQGKLISKGEDN